MTEQHDDLAAELLHYFEQEEARLNAVREVLERLQAGLIRGDTSQLSEILEEFLRQAQQAEGLHRRREALRKKLPLCSDGRVNWPIVEKSLDSASAMSVSRQRVRLRQLAEQVHRDLRRVAVLAWFGQELYGRMLGAILTGPEGVSGHYDRQGQPGASNCGQLIRVLG